MSRRLEQLDSLLQRLVGQYLLANFEAPAGVLVTITRVATSADLSQAKIYVSILPENSRGSILESLRKISSEIRHTLYGELELRSVPRLKFMIDEAELRAARVEDLIESIDNLD